MRVIRFVDRMLALPLIGLVLAYRYTLSPLVGSGCRFQPTCSVYALDALRHHGGGRGTALIIWRLARCHPWTEPAYDPVPKNDPGSDPDTHPRRRAD